MYWNGPERHRNELISSVPLHCLVFHSNVILVHCDTISVHYGSFRHIPFLWFNNSPRNPALVLLHVTAKYFEGDNL